MSEFELQEIIRNAFAEVPVPANDNIIEHDCDECRELQQAFSGLMWQQLGSTLVRENYDKLPLLSAEALHFYLPAFLIESLGSDDDVWEYTFYELYRSRDERRDQRWSKFSERQVEAILALLEYKLIEATGWQREDIPIAIKMWNRQLAERRSDK